MHQSRSGLRSKKGVRGMNNRPEVESGEKVRTGPERGRK